jgi:cytochrome c peroxidase
MKNTWMTLYRHTPARVVVGLAVMGVALMLTAASAGRTQNELPAVPLGLEPIPWPLDNPYSPEKAELGRLLYFDRRLSVDQTVACASCHGPGDAFTDGQPVSTGVGGQKGGRSAPTVINSAYNPEQFWDGRAPSLEEQAKGPIANPIEMANTHAEVVRRLQASDGYRDRFHAAFGSEEITIDRVGQAIATFERTILSGNSPFDRFQAGDRQALSPPQQRGMQLFSGKAQCLSCHSGFNFTDGQFANTGVGMDKSSPDWGRYAVTKREEDRGAFRTPTLREIAHTGPYMHDGSLKTLEEVVGFYNQGGIRQLRDGSPNRWLDPRIRPLNLTGQETADLVEFLGALSGEGWQHAQEPEQFP